MGGARAEPWPAGITLYQSYPPATWRGRAQYYGILKKALTSLRLRRAYQRRGLTPHPSTLQGLQNIYSLSGSIPTLKEKRVTPQGASIRTPSLEEGPRCLRLTTANYGIGETLPDSREERATSDEKKSPSGGDMNVGSKRPEASGTKPTAVNSFPRIALPHRLQGRLYNKSLLFARL